MAPVTLPEPARSSQLAGAADLIAGAAGGLFAPIAVFGFGLSAWAALPGAALVFFGVRLILAPRRLFEGFDFSGLDRDSVALARDILTDAHGHLDRLKELSRGAKSPRVRERLNHLHTIASRVVAEVEAKPRRANSVRRLLTYYLPSAVRLGEGHRVLEQANAPDRERLMAAEEMIARLDTVFARHADRISDEEVEGLDVEIRLLEDAIRAEEPAAPQTGAGDRP